MSMLYAPSKPCCAALCYFLYLQEILLERIAETVAEACLLHLSDTYKNKHYQDTSQSRPRRNLLVHISLGGEEHETACYFLAPVQARSSRLPVQPGNSSTQTSAKNQHCLLLQPLFDLMGSTKEIPIQDTAFQVRGAAILSNPSQPERKGAWEE